MLPGLFLCACALDPTLVAAGDPAVPEAPAPQPAAAAPERASRLSAEGYRRLVVREALNRGLPPAVADAVAFVESGYAPGAVGAVGELGLMQVRPATAAMLGHTGPASALLDPATNIRFGVAYLAQAWKLAGGDLCRALTKYRAGHGEEHVSPRSADYCRRARARLAAAGSPLAAALPVAATAAAWRSPGDPARQAAEGGRRRLWAEHAGRIRAIEARVDRIMGGG